MAVICKRPASDRCHNKWS